MSEDDRRADEVERELDDMEQRSEELEGEIEDARDDWDRKKRDPSVPGAAGDPERGEQDPPPEQDYPSKGD